ncbi:nuclear transport factor 2 family protein [Kibdelosporangium philippinense]|uniref:Nuclear transport factor 2 family protein n=1 Tax=Kibdelosporangium philippinense TaxID=211113 RepID=A0ABS8ZHA0_9PSEU|nr:nuclear transport factor 2 family protein [Kibdelosporangium philippinense]MCE7007201.1 nuclear transport factor 2 family protein [Kibdelosporangium philippinense]
MEQSITQAAVHGLVQDWFTALDQHDDVEVLLDLLTDNGLVLHLPQGTVRTHEEFRDWHADMIATYFDEVRDLRDVRIHATSPLHAQVLVRVNWQSRMWVPPSASSVWVGVDSTEEWSVVLRDGKPKIRTCTVGGLTPMPGSAAPRGGEFARQSAAA